MKGLITSGGKGTRLRPITHTNNKHLIPIANKPMIFYAIEAFVDAGIREIGIVVNPETSAEIKEAAGNGSRWGIEISYIVQERPLGLAHVVRVSEDYIGESPFIFYLGDNVVVGGISGFIDKYNEASSNCHLVLSRTDHPERFGVADVNGTRVLNVIEKPQNPSSDFAVTGIYIYDRHIFEAVKAINVGSRGEYEISDAHQYLIDNGLSVSYSEITGWWKDTGQPDDLLEANRLVLDQIIKGTRPHIHGFADKDSRIEGKVIIEDGAEIIKSHIRGPAIIGKGATIQDSYVGPFTSIGDGCTVQGSEIEYSIVLNLSSIKDVGSRIERSLIGKEVSISRTLLRPKTHRLVVGDQSKLELI